MSAASISSVSGGQTNTGRQTGNANGTNGTIPGPEGVGLCQSLKGLARFWREYVLPGDGGK